MAALRVGQRVKKVRGDFNVGITGVVSSQPPHPVQVDAGRTLMVKVDIAYIDPKGVSRPAGYIGAAFEYEWEPILPEGNKASDFSYEQLLEHLKELSHENA